MVGDKRKTMFSTFLIIQLDNTKLLATIRYEKRFNNFSSLKIQSLFTE